MWEVLFYTCVWDLIKINLKWQLRLYLAECFEIQGDVLEGWIDNDFSLGIVDFKIFCIGDFFCDFLP